MRPASLVDASDKGDLIDPVELCNILESLTATDSGRFDVEGSVLDYMIDEYARIISFAETDGEIKYQVRFEWPSELSEDKRIREQGRVKDAFIRAGIARHSNVTHVMKRLRMYDDVIIGIDTNILWDCVLTAQLLDEVYKEPFPNWILIAIPKLVMAETENAANQQIASGEHPRVGWPGYKGRIGQRGLQELMDLREKNPDRPGLAMMTIGDLENGTDSIGHDNWRIDSEIRNQFQSFLSDINFHKGTYFMSQDRVNVMMSGTEGADGLYLQKPEFERFDSNVVAIADFAGLVYELCVQFGSVRIGSGDRRVELDVFWPGKQVADWRNSKLRVSAIG